MPINKYAARVTRHCRMQNTRKVFPCFSYLSVPAASGAPCALADSPQVGPTPPTMWQAKQAAGSFPNAIQQQTGRSHWTRGAETPALRASTNLQDVGGSGTRWQHLETSRLMHGLRGARPPWFSSLDAIRKLGKRHPSLLSTPRLGQLGLGWADRYPNPRPYPG